MSPEPRRPPYTRRSNDRIAVFRKEYRFLSNFYPHPILFEGSTYPTLEHAYQAAKTMDRRVRGMIRMAASPGAAKRMGQKVKLRARWEGIKVNMMARLLEEKFSDPDLRERLIETFPQELVEGNDWGDTFWGVDYRTGEGKNMLGHLLMVVRENVMKNRGKVYAAHLEKWKKYKKPSQDALKAEVEAEKKKRNPKRPLKKLPRMPHMSFRSDRHNPGDTERSARKIK